MQFEYPDLTPFQYAGNKPISYIDLDGAEPEDFNLQGKIAFGFNLNKTNINLPVSVLASLAKQNKRF